jgi:hypothetical protein
VNGWWRTAGRPRPFHVSSPKREEAISVACGMLGRGINVEEIGPLQGMRDGNVIDAVEIRKLQTMRAHDLVDSPWAFLPGADGSESWPETLFWYVCLSSRSSAHPPKALIGSRPRSVLQLPRGLPRPRRLRRNGHELFQYVGADGHRHTLGSSEVNAYLREISGEEITAKDFRTWAGTFLAASALRELARAAGEARASTLVRAAEQVSRHLGNTVAVCRKCYIHPAIFDGYLDGSLVKTLEQRVSRYQSSNIDRMSAGEAAVTAFLRLRLRSAERLRPAARELTAGNARRSIRLKAL